MIDFRSLARVLVSPAIVMVAQRWYWRAGFFGQYESWSSARRHSLGYDDPRIVQVLTDAALKVKTGAAVYERDGVTFDSIQHAWPLLTGILQAARHGAELNVIDVGGALGGAYHQCRPFLSGLETVRWQVIEQEALVAAGRKHLATNELSFCADVASSVTNHRPDVLLLSSVLHYMEAPYSSLSKLLKLPFRYVIVDRTPMWKLQDRLTIQKLPRHLYGFHASYPAWIFNRPRLLDVFRADFTTISEFDALDGPFLIGLRRGDHSGLLLARR